MILEYANRPGMEAFTVADIEKIIPHPHMAAVHLSDMANNNLLGVRIIKQGGGATLHYSKKPTDLLRVKWRKRTDGQIGIKGEPYGI